MLCLDLDDFKQVNDTLGHPVGDELLRAVAERLRACVREVDTVARLRRRRVRHRAVRRRRSRRMPPLLARRIVEVVSAPYEIDGHRVTVGVSIGISLAPGDGTTCDKLLKNADVALYRAKADGRGTWRFFEAEMDARLQARRALELDLREALANERVRALLPADLRPRPRPHRRLRGAAALAPPDARHGFAGRVHPGRRGDRPDRPLGEWVLQRACAEASHWPSRREGRGQRLAGAVQGRRGWCRA